MADRVTLVDVVAAVNTALAATIDDPAIHLHPAPPAAPTLPAVWPWPTNGGGPPRDRPAVIRVIWVAAPQDNAAQWPALYAAVDVLDGIFDAPLGAGIMVTARSWRFDAVDIGQVLRDALLYDLTVTYPNC